MCVVRYMAEECAVAVRTATIVFVGGPVFAIACTDNFTYFKQFILSVSAIVLMFYAAD